MSRNVTLFMLIVTLFSLSANAQVIIQLSVDNETWFDIDAGGNGVIDVNKGFAFAEKLDSSKTYYYRAKDNLTSWAYGKFTTQGEKNMLAIIFGFSIIALFFGISGWLISGWATKLLFWGMALVQILTMVFMLYLREIGEPISDLLYTNFQMIFLISTLIGLIVLFIAGFKILMPSKEDGFDEETKWMGDSRWQGR
jgi:hypothetical protein